MWLKSVLNRSLCTSATPETTRLYRFAYIKSLRALLRVKLLHLSLPVAMGIPTLKLVSEGIPTLADGGMLAAMVGGTVAAASTLSWYCERLVGELAWLPKRGTRREDILRVSTLSMWGERRDHDIAFDKLRQSDGFDIEHVPRPFPEHPDAYPRKSLVPLELCGKTYIFVWGAAHVPAEHVDTLADLLLRQKLPSPPREATLKEKNV